MLRPRFFDLEEFLDSSVARQKGVSNLPSWTIIEHLNELAMFMDQLREDWGSGIRITSGFRCPKLNDNYIPGASKTSVHKIGYACDCYPMNGQYKEFVAFIKEWCKDKQFDQIIEERSGKSIWIHIGLFSNRGEQRRMVFKIAS